MITQIEFHDKVCGFMMVDGKQELVYYDDHQQLLANDDDGSMRQVGYVFYKPAKTINLIRRFPPEDLMAIKRLVEAEKGEGFAIGQPPQRIEVDDEEDDDEDEDES